MSRRRPSLLVAALRGRCPNCGEGALFSGLLAIRSACAVCGEDFRAADTGDGPAVFVMFLVGAIVVPIAMALGFGLGLGPIVILAITSILAVAFSLALLRPFKAGLFALQWRHKAQEARLSE